MKDDIGKAERKLFFFDVGKILFQHFTRESVFHHNSVGPVAESVLGKPLSIPYSSEAAFAVKHYAVHFLL